MPDIDELSSLRRRLENKRETLLLIQERKSEYALSTDIPLDLIREERDVQEESAALEAQIKALEQTPRTPAAAPAIAPKPPATMVAGGPEATRAAAVATPAAAFAPAKPTPTLTPPAAVNMTNNREGRYEKLALQFDQTDTLHLVFASPLLRSAGDYFHQQLPANSSWTQAESLTNGFDYLWTNLELRRNAQGQLCVLWGGIDKAQGEAWYMRCQTGPDWLQKRVTQWRPKTFDTRAGFSAIIRPDGGTDAAFVRVGNDEIAFNDTPDIMPDHLAQVGYYVDLERDEAGNYHIVWTRLGDPSSLEYRRSSDGGRTWTQTERLTGKADAPDSTGGLLVTDSNGAVHLVWDGLSEGIYYRRWTSEAGWSEVTELSQGINGRSPQVAVDGQGLARVTWDASPGIWHAKQASDGSWSAPRLIASGGNGFDYSSAQIAVDSKGRSHVVWLHDSDIYYTVVD